MWVSLRAYGRVEHLKGASLGMATAYKHQARLLRLAKACQGQTLLLITNITKKLLH